MENKKHLELKSTSIVNYLKEMLNLELIEKIRDGRNISYKIKISKYSENVRIKLKNILENVKNQKS